MFTLVVQACRKDVIFDEEQLFLMFMLINASIRKQIKMMRYEAGSDETADDFAMHSIITGARYLKQGKKSTGCPQT